ncbi:MAG TPA: amylo-alpha-1,6-glucosidase [Chloroflexota bacterium]
MDTLSPATVQLEHNRLRGRSFLLGNKRAFSLCLPAAAGIGDAQLHPHKWFGAFLYGQKVFEAQYAHARVERNHVLNGTVQTGFTMGLTMARREYAIDGRVCTEEYFVPDGVPGFSCTFSGDATFSIEPELDLRFALAFNPSLDDYEVEFSDRGAIVSNLLPEANYDDASESYLTSHADSASRLYAAIEVVGDEASSESLPLRLRRRSKLFRKDMYRQRFVAGTESTGYSLDDHAPLWKESRHRVFAPVRLTLSGHGTVVYGFGRSAEEALDQMRALRDNLVGYQVQKVEAARGALEHAHFETGLASSDTAYRQVFTRFTDALVARNATAADTALDRPATMILAGNQYFHDSWKRDENIAVGVLLSLGLYDLARDVIRDSWQLQDPVTGRLPQRIRAGEEPPYHSSDGTLWALLQLHQYWRLTGDESLLHEKLPMVRLFFERSIERTVEGMLPSGRTHTPEYLWETWMDTPHTPRDGFPIEIQMLWLACLRRFRPVLAGVDAELGKRMEWSELLAWHGLQRFNVRGVPADSLDDSGLVRDFITPNPYFCFGLGLDLGEEIERRMRDVGRRQLAGRHGIVTLSPNDWSRVFPAEFLSDRRQVRGRRMKSVGKFNYHRGVEWNWLSQFFVMAELKYGEPNVAFRRYLSKQLRGTLERGGIGGISELHDLSGARGPEFQSWSMAGLLQALHAFAGVSIDVPDRHITIEPQLPAVWPKLEIRKWYGSIPFDVHYTERQNDRHVQITFPWQAPVDVTLDVGLLVSRSRAVQALDVSVDGQSITPEWRREHIPGETGTRVRITVPAGREIDITVGLRRSSAFVPLSA